MTLKPSEFIRRFLIHVLPKGFHRIRHYGLFSNAVRDSNLTRARDLLHMDQTQQESHLDKAQDKAQDQTHTQPSSAHTATPP